MKKVVTLISLIFLGLLAIITIFPFIYMILAGLMTYSEATSIPPTILPESFQWSNYAEVFTKAPFLRYFLNTVFVSAVTTIATLITAILAAFALTSLEFKFKGLVIALMISLLMVPYESIIFTKLQHDCSNGVVEYLQCVDYSLSDEYLLYLLPEWLFEKHFEYLL